MFVVGRDLTDALRERIERLVVKTVLTIEPQLAHTYYMACSRSHGPKDGRRRRVERSSRCFELLGFDVLLDEHLRPWLMEVNHSPSFGTDTPLDAEVHSLPLTFDVLAANTNMELNLSLVLNFPLLAVLPQFQLSKDSNLRDS